MLGGIDGKNSFARPVQSTEQRVIWHQFIGQAEPLLGSRPGKQGVDSVFRQMMTRVESGIDRSIEKWGVKVDVLAFSLKSRKMGHSVVTDQLLDEGHRWSLQRDGRNHVVHSMTERVRRM
jgi:hypothetical protein